MSIQKLCECGCGEPAPIAQENNRNRGRRKGRAFRFRQGHGRRVQPRRALEERFWEKVDKSGNCWVWMAGKNKAGYGVIYKDGQMRLAHRISWMFENGEIPKGFLIRHKCDNPSCIRPTHLVIGTHSDNMRDMAIRNRASRNGKYLIGEKNGFTDLIASDVLEIRTKYANENCTQRELAKQFSVSQSTIGNIVHRRTWKHVR